MQQLSNTAYSYPLQFPGRPQRGHHRTRPPRDSTGEKAGGSTGRPGSIDFSRGITRPGLIQHHCSINDPADPASTTKSADQPSLEELRAAIEAHPDSAACTISISRPSKEHPEPQLLNTDSVLGLLKLQYDTWIQRFPTLRP